MSASEKLKWVDLGPSEDLKPQIVAVVEAAERLRLSLRNDPRIAEQSFGVQSAKPPFDAALAALDEALGGGDVT